MWGWEKNRALLQCKQTLARLKGYVPRKWRIPWIRVGRISSCMAVIPNPGYAYPQGYESEHLGVREKKNWIMAGKKAHVNSVRQDKFEITATILIRNILLIWWVQFMEIGCQGVRKWKKNVGNHWCMGFMGKRESGRVKVKTHTSKTGNTEVIIMCENENEV